MNEPGLRILVVDDERAIRRFLRASLTAMGHVIFEAATGKDAINTVIEQRLDIIFLDLGLPDIDGLEVTKQLREWSQTPIIILSVRDQEKTKIQALDAGADDYLTKPFGMGELMARVRGVLRRSYQHSSSEPVLNFGNLQIDLAYRQVSKDGSEINLTPTEYDLLKLLMQNAGKVLTHKQIIQKLWGGAFEDEAHLLRVNISNLRKKIENDPTRPLLIITEPGVGYRLRLD